MKSYDELKAEMEPIQQQMVEAKKNERANLLDESDAAELQHPTTADETPSFQSLNSVAAA